MILEALISLFSSFIILVLDGITSIVTLPVDFINTLSTITGYGAYFVGGDLLLIFFSTIFWWTTIKLTLGIVLFIWKLLPFT